MVEIEQNKGAQETGPFFLIINSGSSSLKVSLFNVLKERVFDGDVKGIGKERSLFSFTLQKKEKREVEKVDMRQALELILKTAKLHVPDALSQIWAVGHRIVHGGERLESVQLDAAVIAELKKLSELAPLHNKVALDLVEACGHYFGDIKQDSKQDIKQIAVFDTAFHASLPAVAASYAIDKDLAAKWKIRRYGFHGISHSFLWQRYLKAGGSAQAKVISLHLGNGCSMAAIDSGRVVDTTMGFTPNEGLVMATRCGDIDAALIPFLCRQEALMPEQVLDLLNQRSGLLGVSKISSKMEDLLQRKEESAQLAIALFCYRIVKYIGAYLAVLKGGDALIFSGGIGENAWQIRERICQALQWLGVELDLASNQRAVGLNLGAIQQVSASQSKLHVFVVASDENEAIAQTLIDYFLADKEG